MKIPIIKYSDKFLNTISIFMNIGGITLFPFIILREKYRDEPRYAEKVKVTINHEKIHIKQQIELLVIPFFMFYFLEWFIKLFKYGSKSYYNISFEREAYANEENFEYLTNRKWYSSFKYIFNK